jgi:hypothetical protein
MGCAVAYHYVLGVYGGAGFPYNTFLFIPSDRFMDFFNDYRYALQFLARQSSVITYTPLSHLVMTMLTLIPETPALLLVVAAFLATILFVVWRTCADASAPVAARVRDTVVLGVFTYPVLVALDRGNQEMMVFILLALFTYLHYKRGSRWGLVFLALACALKIYPILLTAILLAERRYRDFALVICGVLVATLVAAAVLGAWSGAGFQGVIAANLGTLTGGHGQYAMTPEAVRYRHSLWSVVGALALMTGHGGSLPDMSGWYTWVSVLLMAACAAYVVFVEPVTWRRLTVLVVGMLVLPQLSGDYTMLGLYVPLILFLNTKVRTRLDLVYAGLFGLLLVPLDYIVLVQDVKSSVLLYPGLMVALVLLILIQRFLPHEAAAGDGVAESAE